ncbi:choice-of-anchor I family protein [Photobacterium leiognathi]|uniref:choice-of-anchor I family protein n=1 Tax=Photobacterium leiognathi TaxID=553611 RepID=UPI002981A060|nr:choice-of-anchor I family protein [Photobacterium leiognathi]
MKKPLLTALVISSLSSSFNFAHATEKPFEINLIGRALLNAQSPEGAAEIVAYQNSKKRIFAINGSGKTSTVEIIDATKFNVSDLKQSAKGVTNNSNLSSVYTINLAEHTKGNANSIAIAEKHALAAVAIAADKTGEKGSIAFYDISGDKPAFIKNVEVGYLPDMVTFTPDETKVIVANEGEPSGDYLTDPEGSIGIITIDNGKVADKATLLGFNQFNAQQAKLEQQGMVFSNPNGQTIKGKKIVTTVAQDIEPEYVAVSKDSKKAYVSLQENNGIAIVDLATNTITLQGLGFKDWSKYKMDASDKDGGINMKAYPGLYGMYQPDTLASYTVNGKSYVVIANEGDGREYFFDVKDEEACKEQGGLDFDKKDGCLSFVNDIRAKKLTLAGNFNYLKNDETDIGRLKVNPQLGDKDGDGKYEALYTFGGRSFSILDSQGKMIFDSADEIGLLTAKIHGQAFNNDEDENAGDARSDAKGAEPEALTVGQVGDRTYAFVGLERMGGVVVYDITEPSKAHYFDYFINRGLEEGKAITGDLAPEGMTFVSAENSATGKPLVIIGNEISGSVAVWEISAK